MTYELAFEFWFPRYEKMATQTHMIFGCVRMRMYFFSFVFYLERAWQNYVSYVHHNVADGSNRSVCRKMKCATKTCVYECGEAKKKEKRKNLYRTNINKSSSGVCLRFLFLFAPQCVLFWCVCAYTYIYWSHRARALNLLQMDFGQTHTHTPHTLSPSSIKYDVCTTTSEITHCVHIWCSLGAFYSEKWMRIEIKNCVKRFRILDFAYIRQCACVWACGVLYLFLHKWNRKKEAKRCSSNFTLL